MAGDMLHLPLFILMVGIAIVMAILAKALLQRLRLPPLIGYLAIGFLFSYADSKWGFISEPIRSGFNLLAGLGIITLLFQVGLESDIKGLIRQFPRAMFIWIFDVFLSAALGFGATFYLLKMGLIPSLFVGAALSCTSVGVTVAVWHGAGALRSKNGGLLVDTAEMDDISGVVLMALLLAVAPILKEGGQSVELTGVVGKTAAVFGIKLFVFGGACILFSRFAERHVTNLFLGIKPAPDPMLLVAGTGFVIAALAELIGFSVAIGAMFAGLVFSRDPEMVKIDASFQNLYELFAPFFFIGIGMSIEPCCFWSSVGLGGILLVAAVLGKFIGAGGPALFLTGWSGACLIGISMIPRAEIAMIIMQQGKNLGDWAVSDELFAGIVLVAVVTSVVTPFLIMVMLRRWPQKE